MLKIGTCIDDLVNHILSLVKSESVTDDQQAQSKLYCAAFRLESETCTVVVLAW